MRHADRNQDDSSAKRIVIQPGPKIRIQAGKSALNVQFFKSDQVHVSNPE